MLRQYVSIVFGCARHTNTLFLFIMKKVFETVELVIALVA